MTNSLRAGAYAGMTHYLKAVKQIGVAEAKKSGTKTVEVMKSIPTGKTDVYATTPTNEAFCPPAESACRLMREG